MPRAAVSLTLKNPKQFGRAIRELVLWHPPGSLRAAAKFVGLSPHGLAMILEGKRKRIRRTTLEGLKRLCSAVRRSGNKSARMGDSWTPAPQRKGKFKKRPPWASRITPRIPKRRASTLLDPFRRVAAYDAQIVLTNAYVQPTKRRNEYNGATPAETEALVQALDRVAWAFRAFEIGITPDD